jgi:ubiquinone biosynthesis protein COQ9
MTDPDIKAKLLDAAKMHVPFDGWSEDAFQAAIRDTGIEPGLARAVCPRGAVDLALAYHAEGDALMLERLTAEDLSQLRFRDRVAAAVRYRLEAVDDKELVRRGMTLFSLPMYAADGAKAVWGTCDLIWTALGDTSDDVNWYTKRATLSGVYSATLLYWLGDDSPDHEATWAFLDRRIDNVMSFEKLKAQMRDNKVLSGLMAGPLNFLGRVRAPQARRGHQTGMPGRWTRQT